MFVAHKSEDGRLESLEQHAAEVAEMARTFAEVFGGGSMGYAAGLLHDSGKASEGFQRRILHNGPKVEHSAGGAKLLMDTRTVAGLFLAYCVAGHHGGLPNFGTSADSVDDASLTAKMKREAARGGTCVPIGWKPDVRSLLPGSLPVQPIGGGSGGFSAAFLIRMLFSCLVDADFLCTEAFMRGTPPERSLGRVTRSLLNACEHHVQTHFADPRRPIDRKRCEIREACDRAALLPPGLFTLTVPTGGGKTIASLSFALRHALEHGKDRVIYVIPYTSIIDQTVLVFRGILGNDAVLEHHSNVRYDDDQEDMSAARLATENWDAPVVVTTNVQFFESLFSCRTSRCRKLHNIANSVIVFDEAQMLPVPFLRPCLWAICELAANYRCSAVLMSATQPTLAEYFPAGFNAQEICRETESLYDFFRRARLQRIGSLSPADLSARLAQHEQVLCIVNSRKRAQELYRALPEDGGSFHLSTLMPPMLRARVLNDIRRRVQEGLSCRVVSTSLVEAGVDLDFPTVYRQEAGLDSQIQAAGRCNREGKRPLGESLVYVFRFEDEGWSGVPSTMRLPIEVGRMVAESFDDLASPEAIRAYFTALYQSRGAGLDQLGVVTQLEACARANFPFADLSDAFRLIQNDTKSVFIPLDDAALSIVKELVQGRRSRRLMRQAAGYIVQVYRGDWEALLASGLAMPAKLFRPGGLKDDMDLAILTDIDKGFSLQTGLLVPDLGIGLFV